MKQQSAIVATHKYNSSEATLSLSWRSEHLRGARCLVLGARVPAPQAPPSAPEFVLAAMPGPI